MEDFASAAMMRLVQAGLARQGVGMAVERPSAGPHVPLASKRDGVERILTAHGPLALLKIGEALPDVRDAPLLAALENAPTPLDVVDRWRRLESFAHSRHRTEVLDHAPQAVTLRHMSRKAADPPRRSEDLLIFGVLVALIGWVGAIGLHARPLHDAHWAFDGEWRAAPNAEDCASWRIEWRAVAPTTQRDERGERPGALAPLLRSDLMRRWTIADAAKALGSSTRSLQRALREGGSTFSQTLADVRAAHAVRLLDDTDLSLGEIGFLSGYADQAHFTRAFKAAMAVAPRAYRLKTSD